MLKARRQVLSQSEELACTRPYWDPVSSKRRGKDLSLITHLLQVGLVMRAAALKRTQGFLREEPNHRRCTTNQHFVFAFPRHRGASTHRDFCASGGPTGRRVLQSHGTPYPGHLRRDGRFPSLPAPSESGSVFRVGARVAPRRHDDGWEGSDRSRSRRVGMGCFPHGVSVLCCEVGRPRAHRGDRLGEHPPPCKLSACTWTTLGCWGQASSWSPRASKTLRATGLSRPAA